MNAASATSIGESSCAGPDLATSSGSNQLIEGSMTDELRARPSTGNGQKSLGSLKVFGPETFYVKWDNGKVIMFRPEDLVDLNTHTKITIDSMSWDKFCKEIETRLDIELQSNIMYAIVEEESGYKKPPIHITDSASWRALLRKFHYEGNKECFFFITPSEGFARRKASYGSKVVWFTLLIALVVAGVLTLVTNINPTVGSTVQEYWREFQKRFISTKTS